MGAIAIVGMGCRFADAPDLSAYWQMMLDGKQAFTPVPEDRWPAEVFYSTNRRATDKSYAPHGAWIDDIKTFPALALGLPPRRVEVMDPQQRFAIEVSLQAIQDAGYSPSQMPRRTGVYMGITAHEYRVLSSTRMSATLLASGFLGDPPDDLAAFIESCIKVAPSRPYTAPGTLGNMCAAAVAQELDLHGPAYTTDAACASAHMAIFDALCQLRAGTIDAALAGGAYICVTPEHHLAFSRIGAMSEAGYCRPFDSEADGFVQGDGAGVVVLKRLEDAERDGDRIYAVIHGAAINNDGKGDGPMAPLQTGQIDVIRDAWRDAKLDPTDMTYMEAHGTGTQVGDQIEFSALQTAVGTPKQPCALGSSKANVGHTMSAAGVAGVIRTALAVHHSVLPPLAGFRSPKPELGLDDTAFYAPTEPVLWDDGDRIAGVSSFGFGGTNGHIVMGAHADTDASVGQTELVLMSAPTEAQLRDLAGRTATAIGADPTATVAGVARAWANRTRQAWRVGIVATDLDDLLTKLQALAAGQHVRGVRIGEAGSEPTLAFLYPGQGAQRVGMLRGTVQRFPVVQSTLDALQADLVDELPVPLTHLVYPELRERPVDEATAAAELTATQNCQPAMLAAGVALTALLDQVGVRPTVVAGHSLGEFTAAAAGGVLSGSEAARFVARRGRAMADLHGDHGSMAAIMADADTAKGLLVDGAVIANINHPRQLVVSGTTQAIAQVVLNAKAAGVKAVQLQVSHGFHSPALASLDSGPLVDHLALSAPKLTVASGIADHPYRDADEARAVFLRHAISPVDFVGALEQCRAAGADLYLQVGAGGPLAAFARGTLPRDHRGILSLAGIEDDDGGAAVLETLAQLWCAGVDIDILPITAAAPIASVPPVVLPREHYWVIKAEDQLPIELKGVERAARKVRASTQAAPVQAEVVQVDPSQDEVEARVLGVISKVSAYPLSAIKPGMQLVSDLGFDSLMVGDLATGLSEAFPNVDGIPQELLINRPTVSDIIEFARHAGPSSHTPADDNAPLPGWSVRWAPQALPALGQRALPTGLRVLVAGTGPVADSVCEALPDGAQVQRVELGAAPQAQAADLVVWCDVHTDAPSTSQVMAGQASWPDRAAPLIAALAAQVEHGGQPDVMVLCADGDPWAAGLHGVVRSLGREWPKARATSLHIGADTQPGAALMGQLTSASLTADVQWREGVRSVLTHERADDAPAYTPGPDDLALITGGTRGIGGKVAARLLEAGARVLLVGRSAPSDEVAQLVEASGGRATVLAADVTHREAFLSAVAPHHGITLVVHCAGVLADGAMNEVDPAKGALARRVKVDGWLNALAAAGSSLVAAVAVGSWAGRFGNRHQTHYAAANALLSALASPTSARTCVGEFGPWTSSEMVQTIPAPVMAAMRAEGIDFVGDEAGLDALWLDLTGGAGARVHGRDLPYTSRAARSERTLSVQADPFLLDHAIDDTPVLPLAGAADLLAEVAGVSAPFELVDLTLYQGVIVREPVSLTLSCRGDRAELRVGERQTLAYKARVRPARQLPEDPGVTTGGDPPSLSLEAFYRDITFHGPLLQGITSIDAVGDDFVRGRVRVGSPSEWTPNSPRASFAIDPLVLDSAYQLAGYVAWVRYGRAGTPVGMHRYVQLAPFPEGAELHAEVRFGEAEGDRFSGTVWLRDDSGAVLAVAENVVAELVQADAEEPQEEPFEVKPEYVDPATWPEVTALSQRLEGAALMGIRNPYFAVHQGTARDTTLVDGRELVNFSSYNYIGLSGDPRVVERVKEAVGRYGTSVSASRVASGERPFHGELERKLADCQQADDALLFTAGHATNVTTIGHIMGPEDLVIHDEYIHDSILQGIKLSGANRRAYRHEDPEHLDAQLTDLRRHYKKVLILVEGVYSMDGDLCDLPAYVAIKRKHGCMLMVDEAHSFGIVGATGRGIGEHYGIAPGDVDIWMGTLSKSLASCGGWIAATAPLIQYLRYTAPGFVYSAGLTAANGVAALASLDIMLEEPWRVQKLQSNAKFFHDQLVSRGLNTGPATGGSAVIPVITGNSMHALMLSQRMVDAGINVQPIVYPAVPDDAARLRFFLSSTHSEEQLAFTASTCADILAAVRDEFRLS